MVGAAAMWRWQRRRQRGVGGGSGSGCAVGRAAAAGEGRDVLAMYCRKPSGPKPEIQHDRRGRGVPTLT
jgi:hypothetical protein